MPPLAMTGDNPYKVAWASTFVRIKRLFRLRDAFTVHQRNLKHDNNITTFTFRPQDSFMALFFHERNGKGVYVVFCI